MKLVQTCHMTSLHCETSFVHCKLVFSCPNESNIDQKKNSADKHRKKENIKSENTVKMQLSIYPMRKEEQIEEMLL